MPDTAAVQRRDPCWQAASRSGRWKDASVTYRNVGEVDLPAVRRWLRKTRTIQWDYRNIVKRRGRLVRLR